MLQSQESSVKPTTLADVTYNTAEIRYFTKDTTDQQQSQQHHHQHQQPMPAIPSMSLLPELILSSWLQSECNNQAQSPIISIQPIHHTLENATITYDTLIEQQKELVKDVFFSPAMSSISKSTSITLSPPLSTKTTFPSSVYASTPCSDDDATTFCGSQTDGESLEDDFSPSDLLLEQEDASLFFGALDLELAEQQQLSSTDVSLDSAATTAVERPSLLKRKRNDGSPLPCKRDLWPGALSPKSTPPMSPNEYRWDYFDASGEDSSTDDDTASTSHDYQTMKADFEFISMQDVDALEDDDDDSYSSWENRRASMFDRDIKSIKKKLQTKPSMAIATTVKKQKHHKKAKLSAAATSVVLPPENHDHLDKVNPRPTCHPTLYQKLTKKNVDWCRYCGTTEGVNWRPGPWGKRTLCNKHGCDYKGYGFACKLPRLNLTDYVHESLHDRDRPVLQFYCAACHCMESWATDVLVRCEGCYKSYHQKCYHGQEQPLTDSFVASDQPWYCEDTCRENVACGRVVVEISRKRLPLMCAPTKTQVQQANLCNNAPRYTSSSTDRATRNQIR